MADVSISAVSGRRDLAGFVDLPYRLHAGTPWVPPLKLERRAFLARRRGRVVGRVSAQVDRAFNEYHDSSWGMFGFLELEDDPEALAALLEAAGSWLRERGCDRMVGPMDLTMNDESGILIEGQGLEPMIKQPWHPGYYQRLCEGAGLEKAIDLFSWELEIENR